MSITIDELLASAKREPKKVSLPELRRDVWVRALSADDGIDIAAHFRAAGDANDNSPQVTRERVAAQLAHYLCDEDGSKLCASVDDARKLMSTLPMSAVNRIITAGQQHNALDNEAPETLEKN